MVGGRLSTAEVMKKNKKTPGITLQEKIKNFLRLDLHACWNVRSDEGGAAPARIGADYKECSSGKCWPTANDPVAVEDYGGIIT